jgi:hypothetical protein
VNAKNIILPVAHAGLLFSVLAIGFTTQAGRGQEGIKAKLEAV